MLHTLLSHLVKINWRSEGTELGTLRSWCPSLTFVVLVHEENSNSSDSVRGFSIVLVYPTCGSDCGVDVGMDGHSSNAGHRGPAFFSRAMVSVNNPGPDRGMGMQPHGLCKRGKQTCPIRASVVSSPVPVTWAVSSGPCCYDKRRNIRDWVMASVPFLLL